MPRDRYTSNQNVQQLLKVWACTRCRRVGNVSAKSAPEHPELRVALRPLEIVELECNSCGLIETYRREVLVSTLKARGPIR